MSPLVEIGLADLPNIGGAKAPQLPPCDGPAFNSMEPVLDLFVTVDICIVSTVLLISS